MQLLAAVLGAVLIADLVALGTTGSSHAGVTGVAAGTSRSGTNRGSGTTGPGAIGGSSNTTGGVNGATANGTTPGAAGSATTGTGLAGGGGPGTSTSSGPLTNLGHGVSASSIRVVFPWPNVGAVASAIGLYGSSEDPVLSINAAVSAINNAGGINGRKIDPEIVEFGGWITMRRDFHDGTFSHFPEPPLPRFPICLVN